MSVALAMVILLSLQTVGLTLMIIFLKGRSHLVPKDKSVHGNLLVGILMEINQS